MKADYRAWDKERKVMYQDEEIIYMDYQNEEVGIVMGQALDGELYADGAVDIEDLVIQRGTGIIDKKGQEIYEGDIIHWKDKSPKSDFTLEDIVEVFWNDEFLEWGVKSHKKDKTIIESLYDYDTTEEIEVIGNIYENPEITRKWKL